jgi:hypothetical protein
MSDFAFRQALQTNQPSGESIESKVRTTSEGVDFGVNESKEDVPFSDYEQVAGQPLVAEFFGLGQEYNLNQSNTKSKIDEVTGFVNKFIEDGRLENNAETGKMIISKLLEGLGEPNEERGVRLDRLYHFVMAKRKHG